MANSVNGKRMPDQECSVKVIIPPASAGGEGEPRVLRPYAIPLDELLLLTGERVIPIPIAPCIKDGSFAMVERWFPALGGEPIHERYGRRVRYLPLSRPAVSPDAIRSVIFPTWQPEAVPVLRPLSGLDGLTRLG